jgi:hypothetical protein
MSLEATELECAAVATAPRVSLGDIETAISHVIDFTGKDAWQAFWPPGSEMPKNLGVLSVCLVVMRNGFTVVGKSAPASPENFNAELGKKLAYEDAIRQLWPLMGFALRDKLAAGR